MSEGAWVPTRPSPSRGHTRAYAPPDMPVALQTGGIDAAIVWDPWPITIQQQVQGSEEIVRGGGYMLAAKVTAE